MDSDVFKIAGAVAGIGGLALAAVVYIFREVIRKEIFPQLTKEQAYKLLNRIIILVFIIGVLGIVAYLVVKLRIGNRDDIEVTGTGRVPTPTPVRAELSGYVRDRDDKPLQGATVSLDEFPRMAIAETASDGSFWLEDIPKKYGEKVRVRVVKEGYQPNPCIKDLQLGEGSHTISLTLQQRPSRLPC